MYTIEQIHAIIGAKWLQVSQADQPVLDLLIDSRQLNNADTSLFFAFKGHRQDGHLFIEDLYRKGVRSFVVSEPLSLSAMPLANVMLVRDMLSALQQISIHHRAQFSTPVVAITGSNGKTIVKEWLFQLFDTTYHVIKSPKSYNSQIGVPLSVWQLNDRCELAIFEAGVSQVGEMSRLEQIIKPNIGIFTNLGSAHDQGFANRTEKLHEKLKLFVSCDTVICSRDHIEIYNALKALGSPLLTWTLTGLDADVQAEISSQTRNSASIKFVYKGEVERITIPFSDSASIENAMHCLCTMLLLQPGQKHVSTLFNDLLPVAMRLEAMDGINGSVIINDVYNADLESLSVALSFANFQSDHKQRTLILSDLLQQHSEAELYKKVATILDQSGIQRLFAIGSQIKQIRPFLRPELESHFYSDTGDLLSDLNNYDFDSELIVIKGARKFGLERVTERLSLKRHQTVLEINLAALARNLKVFETYLTNPKVKIMAMVKAAAYGSGSVEIARFLESRHVDYMTVAYVDEGVELRKAGITTPIMVLNADLGSLSMMTEFRLEPEIFSTYHLQELVKYSSVHQCTIPIHLKLETGMHRLGLEETDIAQVKELLAGNRQVIVKSVFSHLASSDESAQDAFTKTQIQAFVKMATDLSADLPERPAWHLANSNGIVRFPEAQFDMVRIGIGMYGIGMPEEISLEAVHTLKTYVSQVKEVRSGATIGYGRRESVRHNLKIATVAIGYADGLIRKAGNRRYAVIINGHSAPIVGSICMDMSMIDVTDIEDVSIGSEVTIFGKHPSVSELAKAADTIPYEVFTNLSSRVKRIYIYD